MAIQKRVDYNPGTKSYVGYCTMPGPLPKITQEIKIKYQDPTSRLSWQKEVSQSVLKQKACKMLVWMLEGMAYRWKQPVAYEFTGPSLLSASVKDRCLEIIRESHRVRLMVRVMTCNMGIRGVWRELGINVGPQSLINSFPHPCAEDQRVFVMADVVHAFKNFKEMQVNNKVIQLFQRIVEEHGLQSSTVKAAHIMTFIDHQIEDMWKMTPYLQKTDLNSNHFDKMKVNVARRVVNHRNAAGLFELAFMDGGNVEMAVTGWMMLLMHEWFRYVTPRCFKSALSKKNMESYTKAIKTLELTMDVFQHMEVPGGWKPVQTALKLSTKSILDLAELCLNELCYDFLLTGRLTQDMIENLFSIIRYLRPTPTPLQATQRLRQSSVSMLLRQMPKSSYDFEEEGEMLINIFEDLKFAALDIASDNHKGWPRDFVITPSTVPQKENKVLYRVSEYVVFQVFKVTKLNIICNECSADVLHMGPEPHPESQFTRRTNYENHCQVEVSDDIFNMIVKAEECLRGVEHAQQVVRKNADTFLYDIMKTFPDQYCPNVRKCHNAAETILKRFIQMRLKIFTSKGRSETSGSEFGSLSMGSRHLAKKLK